jgi:hypothetical protein
VKREFKANEYSLIGQNCNHFSERFSLRLLGRRIPSFINRLARAGTWVNFLLPQSLKSLNPIPDGSGGSGTTGMGGSGPGTGSGPSAPSFGGQGYRLGDN